MINININFIKDELIKDGWQDTAPGRYMDIDFDLIVSRHIIYVDRWEILIKELPELNRKNMDKWLRRFEEIKENSKNLPIRKCFVLCLLAEKVSGEAWDFAQSQNLFNAGEISLKEGTGNLLMADIKEKKVYGQIPEKPYDMYVFSNNLKKIITDAFGR
ncbi:MAG: hypothetical protein K8T10_10125 [Candidatus Eremiobacteraeota bacterium]|nr:hypothetical protein [Candidatus Eremiobacteraeota bacterium]